MKKIFIFLISFLILTGCDNSNKDIFADEMENCNSDACGYWKMFLFEEYENETLLEQYIKEGDQYLKITNDKFEDIRYLENVISNISTKKLEIKENELVMEEIEGMKFEIVDNYLVIIYSDDSRTYKEHYQSITKEEYPQLVLEKDKRDSSKLIYKNIPISDCGKEFCGYWKLSSINRSCGEEQNSGNVEVEEYMMFGYIKIDNDNIVRINHFNDDIYSLYNYYYLEKNNFFYLNNEKITTTDMNDFESLSYIVENNQLVIHYYMVDKNLDNDFCIYSHHYNKIEEKDFVNISIYKY